MVEHGYHKDSKIIICDDGAGEAREVYNEFKAKGPKKCDIAYATGELQSGIAKNKNRGLKYFFSKSNLDSILLLDDDITVRRPDLLDYIKLACKDAKLPFMTGYWTDHNALAEENIKGVTGNGWYKDFPIKAETEYVSWHQGSQGVLMYMERPAAEKVGYMDLFPLGYGFEHSIYFSRLLRAHGYCPELFCVLKYCSMYFVGQNIANNYSVDRDSLFGYYVDSDGNRIEKNKADELGIQTTYIPGIQSEHHRRLLQDVYNGYGLYVKEHGLKKSKEILIEG